MSDCSSTITGTETLSGNAIPGMVKDFDMRLAPIVLFVYNRPWHTQQTVEALQKNELAGKSKLFVYSDDAKNIDDRRQVDAVREYIDTITGFDEVVVVKQKENLGLAASIISGVTEIVNKFGNVIVLEDDMVTSPYFLTYMNDALAFYKEEKRVWHISGWNYPIDIEGHGDVFLWRVMNCWGWATWEDRWKYFEKDAENIYKSFNKNDIKRFNLDNSENFFLQIIDNYNNKINTWAIFWYATIFRHNGLCVNPVATYVENIGLDDSGTHCGADVVFASEKSLKKKVVFTEDIVEDAETVVKIKDFYRKKNGAWYIRILKKIYGTLKRKLS